MDRNELSFRAIASYSGKLVTNLTENEIQIRDNFQKDIIECIQSNKIKLENVFNSDQKGICYALPVSKTIDFTGATEIIVKGNESLEKTRITFMPIINWGGKFFTNFLNFHGVTGSHVDNEVLQRKNNIILKRLLNFRGEILLLELRKMLE